MEGGIISVDITTLAIAKKYVQETVEGAGADYDQNDPNGAGYIKNRPCFFTGNVIEEDYTSILFSDGGVNVSHLLVVGDTYRVKINDVSVDLDAYANIYDGISFVNLGDNFADYMESTDAGQTFNATYGIAVFSVNAGGMMCGIECTDDALMKATFGLTDDDLTSGAFTVTITHVEAEAVKLDKRLLPDEIVKGSMSGSAGSASIKVVDIGSESFDPSQLDFSGYSAGDVVLVVQDMGL